MFSTLPAISAIDLAFIAAALILIHLARRWMLLYALLVLPGTFLHELTHWLVAAVLGGKPTGLQVVPARTERGWCLGSVGVRRVTWFNAVPIGIAPLALAPVAWIALAYAVSIDATSWLHWAALYVVAIGAASCVPSRADWSMAASRPLGVLFYTLVLLALGWLRLMQPGAATPAIG
jgi:hypothetical protein